MLMRSTSTPLFKSWPQQPCSEPELNHHINPKSKPNSMPSISLGHDRIKKLSRNLSESDIRGSFSIHKTILNVNSVDEQMGSSVGEPESGGNGGGGGDGEDGGDGNCWDANHGSESMDVYYQNMIMANPGNSMLLSNYATYLKEISGEIRKAEEYWGRAILGNPNDGNVLSLYATLIWESSEDAKRAHFYFQRAIKAAPHNCHIMASYARFLWDAEDQI